MSECKFDIFDGLKRLKDAAERMNIDPEDTEVSVSPCPGEVTHWQLIEAPE